MGSNAQRESLGARLPRRRPRGTSGFVRARESGMILSPRDASWIKGINSRRPRLIASPNGREYDTLSTLSARRYPCPAVPLDFYQPGDIRDPSFGVSQRLRR